MADNIDLLDEIDVKGKIREIEKTNYDRIPEDVPLNLGAYNFNEVLPFEDEMRAFVEYYENRVSAITRYKSKYLVERAIVRLQRVLEERLKKSNIPEEMRFVYEDMINDLPDRIRDESIIFSYQEDLKIK